MCYKFDCVNAAKVIQECAEHMKSMKPIPDIEITDQTLLIFNKGEIIMSNNNPLPKYLLESIFHEEGGKKWVEYKERMVFYCPNCNEVVNEGDTVCKHCKSEIDWEGVDTSIPKKPNAEIKTYEFDDVKASVEYSCPSCKHVIAENQDKCPECGAKLDWHQVAKIKLVPSHYEIEWVNKE